MPGPPGTLALRAEDSSNANSIFELARGFSLVAKGDEEARRKPKTSQCAPAGGRGVVPCSPFWLRAEWGRPSLRVVESSRSASRWKRNALASIVPGSARGARCAPRPLLTTIHGGGASRSLRQGGCARHAAGDGGSSARY